MDTAIHLHSGLTTKNKKKDITRNSKEVIDDIFSFFKYLLKFCADLILRSIPVFFHQKTKLDRKTNKLVT